RGNCSGAKYGRQHDYGRRPGRCACGRSSRRGRGQLALIRRSSCNGFLPDGRQEPRGGGSGRRHQASRRPLGCRNRAIVVPADGATAVAEAAVAEPVNGTIEIAGPDAFPIDEIVGKVLEYDKDPRTVLVDPEALYFGVKLNDQSLIPGPNARHGSTKFDRW